MLTSFSFQVQWLLYCGWVFFLPAAQSFSDWNRSPLKNVVTFAEKQFCHFCSKAAIMNSTVVVTGCVVYLKTSHLLPSETSEGLLLKFGFDCIKEKGPVTFTTTFNVLRNLHAPFPRLLQRAISWGTRCRFLVNVCVQSAL